jgi:hypothetical protein
MKDVVRYVILSLIGSFLLITGTFAGFLPELVTEIIGQEYGNNVHELWLHFLAAGVFVGLINVYLTFVVPRMRHEVRCVRSDDS